MHTMVYNNFIIIIIHFLGLNWIKKWVGIWKWYWKLKRLEIWTFFKTSCITNPIYFGLNLKITQLQTANSQRCHHNQKQLQGICAKKMTKTNSHLKNPLSEIQIQKRARGRGWFGCPVVPAVSSLSLLGMPWSGKCH